MNSEAIALPHLTSFTEEVSLSQMSTFIYQEFLYEIQRNAQHSDGKTRSQRIWASYVT